MKINNKYFLLRHGQTIYQKNDTRINYPADADFTLPITEEGKEMIKAATESLKNKNIDLIFASPALRAKQSAEIAAKILDIKEINYDERLLDIKMGIFAEKTYEEYEKFFSNKLERFKKKPEGAESWNDIILRLKSFLKDIEQKYKNKNILIVSHADPLWLLAGLLKSFAKEEEFLATRKTENNLYPQVGELIEI